MVVHIRVFQSLLALFQDRRPSAELIRRVAREQWRLICLRVSCSLVEAFSEAATLAVIFTAVQVLSAVPNSLDWGALPIVNLSSSAVTFLTGLQPTTTFLVLLLLAVLLQASQSLVRYLGMVSVAYFAARCVSKVTTLIHGRILSFSFPCASSYKIGDLGDYSAGGPEAIRKEIELSSDLLINSLLSITYLSALVAISPWLLMTVAVMAGLIVLVQRQLLPRIRTGSLALSAIQVKISTLITENFQALRLLHSSGQLEAADQRLMMNMSELERQVRRQGRLLAIVGPLSGFLPILAIAFIAAFSVLFLGGRNTGVLPSLVTFVVALQRLNARIGGIANIFSQFADNRGRMVRLNDILSSSDKDFRRLGGYSFQSLRHQISFRDVSLSYSEDLPLALSSVSFDLPKGQMLALVGPSGAGKSSIADLLVGLYAPTSGQIIIDNRPLDQIDLVSWQRRLGVVSQDTFLFNATIADNVSFGTPNASFDQIRYACEAAQAAGFIDSLPDGYNTMVGERGYRLSGGQRQRLSLARAILRDPELLILDEATSALDTQSERLVQEAIERFERNHTVLVIAHRLSTIVRADQILVLDHGSVVERGNHASLLANKGVYADLWHQQFHTSQETSLTSSL